MKILLLGDIFAIAIVTFIGFATHGETDLSFLPRFAAVFFPLSLFWILFAYLLRLLQPEITSNLKQLWRVPLTMLFAAPLAVLARSFILQTEIVPIFILALGGTSALGMTIWRGVYFFFNRKGAGT